MKKIPVGATIAHAYRFAFGHGLEVLKAIWLPLLAQLAVALLLTRRMAVFMTAMQAHDPSAVNLFGPLLLLFPLAVIFFFAQFTAATEVALGRPSQTWFAFHFDKPMWRLLGGFLAAVLVVAVAALVALIALGVVAFALNLAMPGSKLLGALVPLVGTLVFLCVVAFTGIRFLFLLAPINISEQQLGLRQAWELSAGHFWRLLLIVLAITIPVAIINYAYVYALAGVPSIPSGASREVREAAEMAWRIRELNIMADRWYLTLPLSGLLMLFQFGALCAAQVFAYRLLTEKDVAVPVAAG